MARILSMNPVRLMQDKDTGQRNTGVGNGITKNNNKVELIFNRERHLFVKRARILSMNPVHVIQGKNKGTGPGSTDWSKHVLLPKFEGEGNDAEMKLENKEIYITLLPSGIMYTTLSPGEGKGMSKNDKKVSFRCNHYKMSDFVETIKLDGSPSVLAKKFGKGLEEAIDGMRHDEQRRIIIPPKVSILGGYRVLDVKLIKHYS